MNIFSRYHPVAICIFMALLGNSKPVKAIEFNIDLLDAEDKANVDLSQFSRAGYIMPGTYTLNMRVNDHALNDIEVPFFERSETKTDDGQSIVEACLSGEQAALIGFKPDAMENLTWWHNGECVDFSPLSGITVQGQLTDSSLLISVPQAWLEYQDASWLPPSRWEDGLPGLFLDYNVNTSMTKPQQGNQTQNASGSGTAGVNLGPWRLRGDWQANYNHTTGNGMGATQSFDWSRLYAFRAIRSLQANLTMGESYLTSDIFDSWRYTGASLASDDRMLPPRLRGYAPEVTGIARTNAKVIVSQQGRTLYETTVASGPFRIQDLSNAVNGKLDIRVEEQDGSVQTYAIDTATIPYLTRPGQVRYKVAAGRPSDYDHHVEGPTFGSGEFSWGISNAWSLYGGVIAAGDYNSVALGLGRDLLVLGAISADVTQSVARLPGESNTQGKSWRVSYSKRFDELNSEVTFAGYRFSEKDYMSMGEYLDRRYKGGAVAHDKELYTITFNKSFPDQNITAFANWSHQTYWDKDATDRYSLSVSQYFDLGDWHNLSFSASATRSEYNGRRDDMAYLSLSIPFGSGSTSYNGSYNNGTYTQTASWLQRLEGGDSYRVQAGSRSGNGENMTTQASGYYSHNGELADMSANMSWSEKSYTSAGISLSGGITATTKGAALHPGGGRGGTRMMVSTDGVGGVPVGGHEKTNLFGIAVVPDVTSYYRYSTSIDVNKLPDDIETAGSPVAEAALTEGAIGYRRFDVLKGSKIIGMLRLADGSFPPFGATVRNANNRELGIVNDGGMAWIVGINPKETLTVNWSGEAKCQVTIPDRISTDQMLLPCVSVAAN